jgi:hypothetical protein
MACNECPICYDAITAETGVVTTSCGHSYHFSCISGWFIQQEKGTCPCCRKEMVDKEDFPKAEDSESDDSEDEYESDEESQAEFTRVSLDQFLRSRGGLGLTEAMAAAICEEEAIFNSSELNALCIGNGGRPLAEDEWDALIDSQEEEDENENETEIPLQISSLLENGQWVRTVLNPEDLSGVSVTLPANVPVEETVNNAATKVQAVWRGFKMRNAVAARLLMTLSTI